MASLRERKSMIAVAQAGSAPAKATAVLNTEKMRQAWEPENPRPRWVSI
jgi:hypothetical protein